MWSTPLAQKGFLRICAQTRRDLSLVYNNPQWRIQGRHPGGPGHPLLLDQSEAWRAEKKFFWDRDSPSPRTSTNGHFSTTDAFFCLQGGHWGEVQPQASQALASPQTSFGVRSSRIHFSPTDVRGEEMNAWRTKPKGRLRGGYPSSRCEFVM